MNKKTDEDARSSEPTDWIESTQHKLRESIEEAKELADQASKLIMRHKEALEGNVAE